MQAHQPKGSDAEANTAADLRLVSVQQLQKIHRDLDACQKVIWLAGCRPHVPNGFDLSYVTDAQERLKEIEGLMQPKSAGWTHEKPSQPGAYYVRGFRLGEDDSRPALVEVDHGQQGQLVCNIHDGNSNDDLREWSYLDDFADRFEWLGPLAPIGGL